MCISGHISALSSLWLQKCVSTQRAMYTHMHIDIVCVSQKTFNMMKMKGKCPSFWHDDIHSPNAALISDVQKECLSHCPSDLRNYLAVKLHIHLQFWYIYGFSRVTAQTVLGSLNGGLEVQLMDCWFWTFHGNWQSINLKPVLFFKQFSCRLHRDFLLPV